MDFSQMNELYLVSKYTVGKGISTPVGLFRGIENANKFVKVNENPHYVFHIDKLVTDM